MYPQPQGKMIDAIVSVISSVSVGFLCSLKWLQSGAPTVVQFSCRYSDWQMV